MRYYVCSECDFITTAIDKYDLASKYNIDFGVDIDDFEDEDCNTVLFLDHKHNRGDQMKLKCKLVVLERNNECYLTPYLYWNMLVIPDKKEDTELLEQLKDQLPKDITITFRKT